MSLSTPILILIGSFIVSFIDINHAIYLAVASNALVNVKNIKDKNRDRLLSTFFKKN
jgi:hypothetical protein